MVSIRFGDKFPDTYFPGNAEMKKSYINGSDFSEAIIDGRAKIYELIESANLSAEGNALCKACFLICPPEFFYMPTSSGGKYHGGPKSNENRVGGNVVHTSEVLGMSSRVLNRYSSAIGVFYEMLSDCLRVACILHDICKYSPGSIWTSKTHGEEAAELIRGVNSSYEFKGLVADAVAGHMYYWKFGTVYDSLQVFGSGSLNGLFLSFMLSECDYYSIR